MSADQKLLTEAQVRELYGAVKDVLTCPRWLSIGSIDNAVELRPGKRAYERAIRARDTLRDCLRTEAQDEPPAPVAPGADQQETT